MAFQRSYSKVWWGSDNNTNGLSVGGGAGSGYHSLDSHFKPSFCGNLSRIQETDDENNSKLWRSHNSPGSLRSQDSGFSDNDETQSSRGGGMSSTAASPNSKSGSPNSIKTIETPPTVIRRKSTYFSPPTSHASRRLSLSAPSSPAMNEHKRVFDNTSDLLSQIDRISLVNSTPKANSQSDDEESSTSPCKCSSFGSNKDKSIRRRRVVSRKTRRNLIPSSGLDTSDEGWKEYNNETVYLGTPLDTEDDNNNTIKSDAPITPMKDRTGFPAITSTPKQENSTANYGVTLAYHFEYENPLLNGHQLSVQHWLDDMRSSYEHEVMSTLQTKSIVQEAFRNLKITTNTVTKIIRQLQQSSLSLQSDFEHVEGIFKREKGASLQDALFSAHDLLASVSEFTKILERRSVFFTEHRADRKKFEDNIEHIKLIVKDTRISLEKQHYIQIDSLHEDIQVLKRFILITLRLVYEKLVRVIVQAIESSQCDLMLRANLNMIATLSNIDYDGFASLSDAFTSNETARALLMVCLDNKHSSIRALALRALATICCSVASINQLGGAGGIEIIKDILSVQDVERATRTEPERREAVSLLTQITAPWHGSQNHKLDELKDCVESIVEGLTDIIETTECCQTLLLCAASLNNLSRIEATSVYSIMSNETVSKLKEAVERRGPGVSIFLLEQIVTMLHNMSGNKKCHSHLANASIISFITFIFQSQFYEKFGSRVEADAHRRTIKTILHIFSRLIHESSVGPEILEKNFVPMFSQVERNLNAIDCPGAEYVKDISFLTKQLNESLSHKSFNRSTEVRSSNSSFGSPSATTTTTTTTGAGSSGMRFNLTRQESYV